MSNGKRWKDPARLSVSNRIGFAATPATAITGDDDFNGINVSQSKAKTEPITEYERCKSTQYWFLFLERRLMRSKRFEHGEPGKQQRILKSVGPRTYTACALPVLNHSGQC
jgi:hypothetical protein